MPKKKSATRKKRFVNKFNSPTFIKLRNNVLGLIFLSLALFFLIVPINFPHKAQENSKNPIKINQALYASKDTANNPVRILIPKASIDLSVIDAKVVDGYWELSENTASYGLGSGQPGQKGNTVIFAHAREGLFYNLKDVKQGDLVYVFTKNLWYRYKINKITAVYPNQVDVIAPTKNEVLTLYTCTGFSDEKRLIVQAVLQK